MSFTRLFLPAFFPALLLVAAVNPPGMFDAHKEIYGSPNYYLTLIYASSPLAETPTARFSGTLVTANGEFPIKGERVKKGAQYIYSLSGTGKEGSFVGTLAASEKCPRFMKLEPQGLNTMLVENLRAGECP